DYHCYSTDDSGYHWVF
nr:immunoglobulin light chain junction region [Macaca mulatta]